MAAVAFHIHPRHDGANLYDAALIELAAPVSVTPAALPAADPLPGPAVVAGWGDTLEPDRLPRTLQQAAVPLLSDSVCAQVHGDGFAPGPWSAPATWTHGGVGACSGDRGAPLFITGPRRSHPGRASPAGGWAAPCPAFPPSTPASRP